jgi:hypothetical protein
MTSEVDEAALNDRRDQNRLLFGLCVMNIIHARIIEYPHFACESSAKDGIWTCGRRNFKMWSVHHIEVGWGEGQSLQHAWEQ